MRRVLTLGFLLVISLQLYWTLLLLLLLLLPYIAILNAPCPTHRLCCAIARRPKATYAPCCCLLA